MLLRGKCMDLIRISESDDWFVDYDKERGMYRVSYFEDNHFKDECWFDCYEEKELGVIFPQTIGDITFYSKDELFEWVEEQQQINKLSILSATIPDEIIDKWNSIGCTSFRLTSEELKEVAISVKRFKNYNHEWWAGRCPRCDEIIRFDFNLDSNEGNRKCYCSKCGQLCDFEDK